MQRLLAPWRTIFRHPGFVVLLGCNLLLGLAYSFVAPFMSMFGTREVGMKPLIFGVFMTVTSLSAIVLSTVLAHWSDTRHSRRAILILGCSCGVAGYVGYALVRDVVWLTVIGSLVLGISTTTFAQLFAHARELVAKSDVPPGDAPLYMNIFRLFFALSWTIGPAVAAWVLVQYSYRGIFFVAAACFFLLLLMILRFVPATLPWMAAATAPRVPLRQALRRPDLLAYFAGFVLIFCCVTMGMMDLPLLVLNELGGDQRNVGIIYSVAPVFEVPFMFYFGLLATKGDQAGIIRTGVIIAVVYYSLLSLVRAPWHVYPIQILSAAMIAVVSGVAITFFQDYLPGQAGTATNLYVNAQRIGSTAGYLLFGVLVAWHGYRAVFLVCAALSAVTWVLFLAFRRSAPAPAGLVKAA